MVLIPRSAKIAPLNAFRGRSGLVNQFTSMGLETHLLVVANETLESPELLVEIERRSREHAVRVFLLAPTPPCQRAATDARLRRAVERFAEAGITATGVLGDSIALVAVREVWDPRLYDEIIVCTLPAPVSNWLRVDTPARIADLTGANVHHLPASAPNGFARRRQLIRR
jgi:hypothetical protein